MNRKPILICYDGSAEAQGAIVQAAELLGQQHAIVLDVGQVLTAVESLAMASFAGGWAEIEELNETQARDQARDGVEEARRAGFEAEGRAVLASPTWAGIVEVADEIDASVIVIGSRGLTGVHEALAESLSHTVAEHAGRPVLIVPRPTKGH